MRLSTITNWAYGATVALTFVSGVTMLLASGAQQREREAVQQRYVLDKATSRIGTDVYALSDHARQYLNTGDPSYLVLYRSDFEDLESVEDRVRNLAQDGLTPVEQQLLQDAMRWADTLHDEQAAALTAFESGDEAAARTIMFGAEYERELNRVQSLIDRFQDRLDRRMGQEVREAADYALLWKRASETLLAITGLLFLFVIYYVFRRRVLRPVMTLSDVVNRLARQDFDAEPPKLDQIDEIGDMADAIRIFRENGIERQRLEAERDADRAVRDLLSRMTQRLQGCEGLNDLQDVVRRFVPQIVPSRAGRLYLIEKNRNAVAQVCSWQDPRHSGTEFAPTDCWALRRGLPHRPSGEQVDVPCAHVLDEAGTVPDTLCLPLTAQRQILGLLYLEQRPAEQAADLPEVYLEMLAETIGMALANLHLRETLRELAMVDPLTGLANRRQLELALKEQILQAEDGNDPLACLMIDVDHFKRFNDVFGHDAGDAVLREVGTALTGMLREPDLAFRYGGEEFTLLLPGLDADRARARAEDVRRRISGLELAYNGEQLGTITVSIGTASGPSQCRYSQLLSAADAALLRAKGSGRNRVEMARARDLGAFSTEEEDDEDQPLQDRLLGEREH